MVMGTALTKQTIVTTLQTALPVTAIFVTGAA